MASKRQTSYNFAEFLLEAEDLRSSGLSKLAICKSLARKYGTTPSALFRRWHRHDSGKKKPPTSKSKKPQKGSPVLSMEEEASLVNVILAASKANKALKAHDITEYVRNQYRNGDPSWKPTHWFNSFLARNKDQIKKSNLKLSSLGRVSPETANSCEEFIKCMKEKLETFELKEDNIINVDEFQLKLSGYSGGRGRLVAVPTKDSLGKKVSAGKRGGCVGSLVAFVKADGSLVYSALILKPDAKNKNGHTGYIDYDKIEINKHNTRTHHVPNMRIYAESGMCDNDIWCKVWGGFLATMESTVPGKEHIVLMDNLRQHTQLQCMIKALAQHIYPMFLPKNTTHFLQPLDIYVFGTLRKAMNQSTSSSLIWSEESSLNHMVRDAVLDGMDRAFTPALIKASFQSTGIFPFNEELIRSR